MSNSFGTAADKAEQVVRVFVRFNRREALTELLSAPKLRSTQISISSTTSNLKDTSFCYAPGAITNYLNSVSNTC